MYAKITFNGEILLEGNDFEPEENAFWEKAAAPIRDIKETGRYIVECGGDEASFNLKKRGTYVVDGVKYPSLYITKEYNNICLLARKPYEEKYLTCVNPESNNYKFYHFLPNYWGIDAEYGRIGADKGEAFGVKRLNNPFDRDMYWIRYNEKLSKGYVDQSDLFLNDDYVPDIEESECADIDSALWHKLYVFSKQTVSKNISGGISIKQTREARRIVNDLHETNDLGEFNKTLLALFAVSPRKTRHVDALLAKSEEDIPRINAREESLVLAMETVTMPKKDGDKFSNHDIEIYEATEKQKEQVMNKLSDRLKKNVVRVYRVIDNESKRRFDDYVSHMHGEKVCQVWHGSRNENILSILVNGLKIESDAVKTGDMLVKAIYAAFSSEKSYNYTSAKGTTWAHGTSDTAFLCLYAAAYGNALDIDVPLRLTKKDLDKQKCDCVHAHAGRYLRADELAFYDENAMTINYLVEFAA